MLSVVADPAPWLAVFGRSHPLLLHAPFGLVAGAALLEFGAVVLRRPAPRGAVLALAWFGAVTAAFASASGLVLAQEPGYGGDALAQHRLAALVFAGLCVLTAVFALLRSRVALRGVLLLAVAAMIPAGHLGGSLSHGETFLTDPLRAALPADASEYLRVVEPLLRRSCTKCHNPRKHRGDLDLSTPAAIQRGGESGKCLVAGKPDDSDLLQRCLLPATDDDVMPPAGKQPRPSQAELEALTRWIKAGAKFD